MNEYFLSLPNDHYPVDGCAMLARDAWQMLYGISELPTYSEQFVSTSRAFKLLGKYQGNLMEQISQPLHGCLVSTVQGKRWHCGIYSTEQMPHHVIHVVGGKVKIEPFHKFKQRFDSMEFFKCRISSTSNTQ